MTGIYNTAETMLNQIKGIEKVKQSKLDNDAKYISAEFKYGNYTLAATACTNISKTITLPSNYEKCDYLFIVKDIDNEKKRETFFIKMDDIAEKILPTEFENSNPFIFKRISKNLKLDIKNIKIKKAIKADKKYATIF